MARKVENEIGGATERGADEDGVFERLARHDIAGLDAALEEVHDGGAGAFAIAALFLADGELRAAVGKAHAEDLDGGGHCIRGIHTAAGAGTGDGAGLDLLEAGGVEFALGVFADGFEDGDDVEGLFLVAIAGREAGKDRAAVNEDGGAVEAGDGDHRAGHVFVAAADRDEAVETFGGDGGFDGVGDDLAGHEAVTHALRAHRDAVGDGDGVEIDRFAAGVGDALLGVLAEVAEVDVARRHVARGRGDGDLGLLEIGVGETDGAEHGAGGRAVITVDDHGGMGPGDLVRGRSAHENGDDDGAGLRRARVIAGGTSTVGEERKLQAPENVQWPRSKGGRVDGV